MPNIPEMPADIGNYPLLDPIDGWAVIVIITLAVLILVLYLRNRENAKCDDRKPPSYLPPYVRPEHCGRHKVGVCYRCCPCNSCSTTRIMEERDWTE